MKKKYETPELMVLGVAVRDVITASGEQPQKVVSGGAQSAEEGGVDWGNMW